MKIHSNQLKLKIYPKINKSLSTGFQTFKKLGELLEIQVENIKKNERGAAILKRAQDRAAQSSK